jgi:hypothetical protein
MNAPLCTSESLHDFFIFILVMEFHHEFNLGKNM